MVVMTVRCSRKAIVVILSTGESAIVLLIVI
jgi:hypothetical protein